jgi:hypothetical protein
MNLYWYKTGADAHWATVTGNWWTDAAHTQQASGIPSTDDSVYILGATAPDTAPSVAVSLLGFDTTGLTGVLATVVTVPITIKATGTLTINNSVKDGASPKLHHWGGVALNGATVLLGQEASNAGTLGDNVSMLRAQNEATGIIGNHLTCLDSFLGGTVGDYLSWDSSNAAIVHTSILDHNAHIGNHATFSNSAGGTRQVPGGGVEGNVAINSDGVVIGTDATFNDDVHVMYATIGANARFNEHAWSGLGTDPGRCAEKIHIGAGVVLASDHAQAGSYGATVLLAANTTFGGGTLDFNAAGSPAETVIDVHDSAAYAVYTCTITPGAYTITGSPKMISTMVSPAAADVRSGVAYDSGVRTGTMSPNALMVQEV